MKKILFITAMCMVSFLASAQDFCFGLKGGINRSSLSTKVSGVDEKGNFGFVAGAFTRVGILGFYVQPELLYNQRKGTFSGSGMENTTTLSYLDVPLLVGKKVFGVLRLNAGPNFQFLMNATQSGDSDPNFSKSNFNDFAIGGLAGVGADLWKLSFDLRYDFSISNLGKEIDLGSGQSANYSTRSQMWQITIGYKFVDL